MFRTSSAIGDKRLTKMLAGPVQPHGQIVAGDAKRGSNEAGVFAIEINALEQFAIGIRQCWKQPLETLAKDFFVFRTGRLGKLAFEFLHRLIVGGIPAVEVDDGMSENSVEPCDGILGGIWLLCGSERFDETVLHQILRQMRIADSAADG